MLMRVERGEEEGVVVVFVCSLDVLTATRKMLGLIITSVAV